MNKNKILVVMAHPDDESFGMGGTIAYYTSKGMEIHLICATKGEAGELPSGFEINGRSIADIRVSELMCAANELGLKQVHFLGYRDSGMEGSDDNKHPRALVVQPEDIVAEKIAEKILEIQPRVIITFDPLGGYKHPDHIAIHKATTKAFFSILDMKDHERNGYIPESLFYQTFNRKLLKFFIKIIKLTGGNPAAFGKNGDINIESFANADFPVHVEINISKFQKQKRLASQCHQSQGAGRFGGKLLSSLIELLDRKELYIQAYPKIAKVSQTRKGFFIQN